jgi:hypothetical protein
MTSLFGWFLIVAGCLTFAVLVRGGYTDRMDLVGWTGAALSLIGGLMVVISTALIEGNLPQVATFAAVVMALGALAFGIVWYIRSRPKVFDTEPVTQRNYVPGGKKVYAWGEYSPDSVKAARANASRIRKGVRA